MSALPNSKPKLAGIDTHALGGSLSKSGTTIVGSGGSNVGLSGLQNGEVLRGNIIVTPTSAVNLVFLKFAQYATNDSNIQIREGTTDIGTVDGGSTGTRTVNVVLEDVTVETHTYSCYTQIDTQQYQYAAAAGGSTLVGTTANMIDTHDLDGSNGQSSHEDHILPG